MYLVHHFCTEATCGTFPSQIYDLAAVAISSLIMALLLSIPYK